MTCINKLHASNSLVTAVVLVRLIIEPLVLPRSVLYIFFASVVLLCVCVDRYFYKHCMFSYHYLFNFLIFNTVKVIRITTLWFSESKQTPSLKLMT